MAAPQGNYPCTIDNPEWDLNFFIEVNELSPGRGELATKVWVDVETTGLSKTGADHILELAMLATTDDLSVVEAFHSFVFDVPWLSALATAPAVVYDMHTKSGLFVEYEQARALSEGYNLEPAEVQDRAFTWLEDLGFNDDPGPVMCGNSVHYDRRMVGQDLPDLEAFFFRRNIDVSSFKEECRRLNPSVYKGMEEMCEKFGFLPQHRALYDLGFSLREMTFYHENFLYITD